MAINTTYLLRHIKRMLGASHRPLPIDDEEILEIVAQETLFTFSKYYPFQFNIKINSSHKVPGEIGVYYLDDQGLDILGVSRVFRSEPTDYGYGDHYYANQGLLSPYQAINQQIMSDMISITQVPYTFNFITPNKVELFPKNILEEDILVTVKAVHPSHLGTIPLSFKDDFFLLALLDVKISLWHILKHYSGLSTAVGSFDLKIEDFEAAEAERKDLLEKFDTMYMKEANRRKLYIG